MRFGSIITPMVIDMNEQQLSTVAHIRAFLDGTREVQFDPIGEDSKRYAFIGAVVRRLRYGSLSRVEKGIVMRYLERTTGYSIAQLKRLVGRSGTRGRNARQALRDAQEMLCAHVHAGRCRALGPHR